VKTPEGLSAQAEIIEIRRVVETRDFLRGAREHTDGLAGYVRDFLKKNRGIQNENGRAWSAEACADALQIPAGTLRRWIAHDLRKPTPVITPGSNREKVARSNTRAILRDPEQRRAIIESLQSEVRDELRADLIEMDTLPRLPKNEEGLTDVLERTVEELSEKYDHPASEIARAVHYILRPKDEAGNIIRAEKEPSAPKPKPTDYDRVSEALRLIRQTARPADDRTRTKLEELLLEAQVRLDGPSLAEVVKGLGADR
jgi:hypothetical protein